MEIFNRRGQSLVETLILALGFIFLLTYLEACHEKVQPYYQKHKIQSNQPTL
jgi:hypothetical protein